MDGWVFLSQTGVTANVKSIHLKTSPPITLLFRVVYLLHIWCVTALNHEERHTYEYILFNATTAL